MRLCLFLALAYQAPLTYMTRPSVQVLASDLMDDEAVIALQHVFSTQWRKKFNKGDATWSQVISSDLEGIR